MFDVIDTHNGRIAVQTFPTFRRAHNAVKRLKAAGAADGRYLVSKQIPKPDPAALPVLVFHTFNTGRLYTVHGQRIAWIRLNSGDVAMWDQDRMIDYVLAFDADARVTDADVLRSYDCRWALEWSEQTRAVHEVARQLRPKLIEAARRCRSIER